jgi:hypothetical protein
VVATKNQKEKPEMTTATKNGTTDLSITIPMLDLRILRVKLVGDSPLISHRWSDKAKREMLDKQMKKAKQAKEAKNPEEDYNQSMYRFHEGRDQRDEKIWDGVSYGFPSTGFKNAAVTAVTHVAGMTKVAARGMFHVNLGQDLVKINGTPEPREDMVRIQMTTDIRYRGEFREWSVDLDVQYNAATVSPEQVVNLFNVAGFAVGVGEWRPEKNGSFGMFHVATTDDG